MFNIKKLLFPLTVIVICLQLTSCASIINGKNQTISVTSNPPGATVSDGKDTWTTPTKISLPRKVAPQLTISKPGYETKVVRLERVISAAVGGNIIIPFGIIGWGIDAMSGAQWRLVPEQVNVKLRKLSPLEMARYSYRSEPPVVIEKTASKK